MMSLDRAAQHNPKLFKEYIKDSGLLSFLNADVNKIISNPMISGLPISKEWSTPPEIDLLHAEVASRLGITDVYAELKWKFNRRFTSTYGQADFEIDGVKGWQIQYASNYWLLLTGAERKNLITHEMCHLAVERLFGYDEIVNFRRVLSHGCQWRKFMEDCQEDPNMIYQESLGLSENCYRKIDLELLSK